MALLPKDSKINTIILLIGIILTAYFIFKFAIPLINKAQEKKEIINEREKEKA